MMVPAGQWQRVMIVALLVVPLLIMVVLSAPGWLLLPFLPKEGKEAMLKLAKIALEWIRATVCTG